MTDILIKGMEMPKDCRYCPCMRFNKEYGIVRCHAVYDNCNEEDVVARDFDEVDMLDTTQSKPLVKPSWCPLVALPEHGRLIDEAKLRERAYAIQRRDRISFTDALAMALIEAETIVEANNE